jgi:integrase
MLYETAARSNEVLALNIEDPGLDARRAPIRSKGGDTEWICWGSGTAHLLPRLIHGRQAGPVFLSERRPGPARRPTAQWRCF